MERAWWIHPGKLTLLFMMPLYAFIVYVVPQAWPDLIVLKAATYISGVYAATGFLVLGALGLFALLGARVSSDRPSPTGYWANERAMASIGLITVGAYAIWFFPVLIKGKLFLDRADLNRMPGITSFTQMGVPFVVCYLFCSFTSRQSFSLPVRVCFWSICVLTFLRVLMWSERLALIELVIPSLILLLTFARSRARALRHVRATVSAFGPYLAIPVLFVLFTATEYFRSWRVYSHTQGRSLVDFMMARLVSYYFTALNNGAGMVATSREWPTFDLFYTAQWAFRFPGIGKLLEAAVELKTPPSAEFLQNFADPEFNNMSGIFPILHDLGTVGCLFYFSMFGFVAGVLYRSMVSGGRLGGLLYPTVFVGLVEVLRVTYLNDPRVVLIFAGALILLANTRRAPVRTEAPEVASGLS